MQTDTDTLSQLYTIQSRFSVSETMSRVEKLLADENIPVYLRFDHSKNARKAGLELLPTQVLLFGSPENGTPLMQENPQVAIDLPLRFVSWQDARGQVWLAFTRMAQIAVRYDLGDNPLIDRTEVLLKRIAEQAAKQVEYSDY